ncbi:MAG TPA: UvrD-helicase domain-containing protein, partial [Devosia sp.]|nr:UvrD-helicase domain-containing protein [Devosia sp.]
EKLARKLNRAQLIARSEAMLDIVAAISDHYELAKRARSLLDFDDLIEKLSALLNDEGRGVWVRYKLDSGISHILVDEGQDTNPRQWEVITALVAEFFYGDSAADRPRTLFVVGDQKQSIFSFQGADPTLFVDLGRQVMFTARTVNFAIAPVKLHFSFRTLPHVLAAVDRVFADPALAAGILEDDLAHSTARAEGGGSVTLWPPIKEVEEEVDPDNWPTEAPKNQIQSAPRRVAERIAREIKGWLTSGRVLPARDRAITADDILILVQVRSVLFHEIIRALIHAGIRTPGADRLAITTHIATLDMMALGDVLSNSGDDLQLAALLRSPLFDISEEDLRAVAQPRGDVSLWAAMRDSAIPSVTAAFAQLRDWRNRLDFERPFNFYSTVLYQEGGLKKFRARLGSEIDDVMAEFLQLALQHEQSAQPSLLGFIAELRSREVTIKRELAEGGSGVRVMTVHGAKGLEAPIVILADTATTEEGRDRRAIHMNETRPLFFHASSNAMHVDETIGHKQEADAAQKAEYWRKLYVAMTRAEDELYITGYLTKAREGVGSWYEAVERALAPESEIVADADGTASALIYPRLQAGQSRAGGAASPPPIEAPLQLPALPSYRLRRIVRPSSAADDAEPRDPLATAAEAARDPETARLEGIALHALLHHLLRIDRAQWPAVIGKALPALLPDHPQSHGALATKAQSILGRQELQWLFAKGSRGEVPILARGARNGAPITVAGRIDRLVAEPGKVTIVDYKSDASVPGDPEAVPKAYLAQLGLYAAIAGLLFPGLAVEAKILWTSRESLMNLPADLLRKSTKGFTIG